MAIIFEMPSLSPTMEKGNLVTWCKNEGDEIAVGDVIAEIDTDKATMEVESIHKGVLAKILVQAGTHDVVVRTPIAIIKQKNDTEEDIKNAIDKALAPISNEESNNSEEVEIISDVTTDIPVVKSEHSEKLKASPLAKRIANEYGIDLTSIIGSGPHGRIVKSDVLNIKQLSNNSVKIDFPAVSRFIDEPISSLRKVIAEKLTKCKNTVPHFYMSASANVTELLKIRRQINDSGKLDTKITVNDLITKAVALALREEPSVNVIWNNEKIRKFSTVDISIAVAVEEGLFTPIIWSADLKRIEDISKEIKDLAKKAKEGKLKPEQFMGGSITISNLGMYDIDSFFSIINPPQGSILSIGAAKKQAIYNNEGEIVPSDIINIGYAVDHRVINGGDAAKFLEKLIKYLENPILLII